MRFIQFGILKFSVLFIGMLIAFSGHGQSIQVDSIIFKGNEKTKNNILKRELDFDVSDTLLIADLEKQLEFNRRKLMNTNLFIWVKSDYHQLPNGHIKVIFEFLEQWYVLAYPVFQLAERNLNDWWSRGHNFDRSIYGVHFIHNNFMGRNEKLMIRAESGFTQRLDFAYFNPYLDHKKTLGLTINLTYSTNKSMAYKTVHDTLAFMSSEQILRERWLGSIILRRRFRFYDSQTLELKYSHSVIADTITKLNPSYFLDRGKEQNYVQIGYNFSYDFRDLASYPLRGKKIDFSFNKYGLLPQDQVNFWEITLGVAYFFDLGSNFFLSTQFKGKLSQETAIPYFNVRGLGYGNELVRGYELNVIDGTNYVLNRNTLKFQWINKIFRLPFIPYKQFNQIPISIYPTAFFDFAYVNNTNRSAENSLINRWIAGAGLGFDLVTYYNLVCKIGFPVINGSKLGMVFGIGREF